MCLTWGNNPLKTISTSRLSASSKRAQRCGHLRRMQTSESTAPLRTGSELTNGCKPSGTSSLGTWRMLSHCSWASQKQVLAEQSAIQCNCLSRVTTRVCLANSSPSSKRGSVAVNRTLQRGNMGSRELQGLAEGHTGVGFENRQPVYRASLPHHFCVQHHFTNVGKG